MTDKTIAKPEKLTDDEAGKIRRMLNITLNAVFTDLLSAGGDSRSSIPRSEVVEVCLDADYLEMYGPGTGQASRSPEDKALLEKFRRLSYEQQKKVAREAFPHKRYSL